MEERKTGIRAERIVGGVGTGKTQALIERAAALLQGGARPQDVLVLCASPTATHAFRARLEAQAGQVSADVRVCTARDAALEVLSSDEAMRWSGRRPRVLTAYEELFLMEDMKVSGVRSRRLREMLKFFYRSWTELADDDPEWLLEGQEASVHELLKENLAFTRSLLEPEAGNLAVNYLRTHDDARAMVSAPHVLVDDYQRQSRASQALAGLMAGETLTVAGDPQACVATFDSYPYEAGLDEFLEAHPDAVDTHLATRRRAAVPAARDVERVVAATPAEEIEAVATLVREAVDEGMPATGVVVAVPNDTWARNVAKALGRKGLDCGVLLERQAVRGDVRDEARCVPARMLCALDLVADPENDTAWRCWCGFGDYLTNSATVAALRAFSQEHGGMGLAQALGTADAFEEHAVGMQRVAHAREQGLRLTRDARGLEGRELLEFVAGVVGGEGAAAPSVVERLCLDEEGDNSPQAMSARARRRLTAPAVDPSRGVVVVPFDQTAGLSPELLVVSGFMNGFIPCEAYFDNAAMTIEQQQREHVRDTARAYALLGKADERLVVSSFTSADLETASRLKLKIERIKLVDGVRTCLLSPSDLLEEALG